MNAAEAIRYLQALITMPKERMLDGRRDPAWCCSEHALVLASALTSCGLPCRIAHGAVYVRTQGSAEDITSHYFVIGDAESQEVFDSSFRWEGIAGIFPGYTPASTAVEIVRSILDDHPPAYGFRSSSTATARVRYVHRHTLDPSEFLDRTSSTSFGKWLTSRRVEHRRFWRAAATTAGGILKGDLTLPKALPEKDILLHRTMRAARCGE